MGPLSKDVWRGFFFLELFRDNAVKPSDMARILGVDFGEKRTGLAATDPLQIAVHPLGTYATRDIEDQLKVILEKENVELIVIGDPRMDNEGNQNFLDAWKQFVERVRSLAPGIPVRFQDEHLTSLRAKEIIRSTVGRKKRRDKTLVDKVSAVLILQEYLKHI
jgi:putative Holliday junction resolvase